MYDNTRAHFSIIYILVLFAVAVACACTLGGEQRNLSTRQLPNTNVHGELEVSGFIRSKGVEGGFVTLDNSSATASTDLLTVRQPAHSYVQSIIVTFGDALVTDVGGTLTLSCKDDDAVAVFTGTAGNLMGNSSTATANDPVTLIFSTDANLHTAAANDVSSVSVKEATATAALLRRGAGERTLVFSGTLAGAVLTTEGRVKISVIFAPRFNKN